MAGRQGDPGATALVGPEVKVYSRTEHPDVLDQAARAKRLAPDSVFLCSDYNNDSEAIQAAIDALPAGGGKVVLSAGTFTLATTVSRAIDNVCIVGVGLATRLNLNGSTAVISAGSQTGWILRDFDTDAGGALGGYAAIVTGAPRVKMVKITGTSAADGSSVAIPHGSADRAKIIGAQVLVSNNTGNRIPPNFTSVGNHEFDFFIDTTNVHVYCISGNSSGITGNTVTILITYEE